MWTFFSDEEVRGLDQEFVAKLDMARKISDVPYEITRGLSTPEHNAEVGGVFDSAHLTGHAADLAASDSVTRYKIIKGAIATGFNRIGIYEAHIHLDDDPTKSPDVIWVKESA